MIIPVEMYEKIIHYPKWNIKTIPHESNGRHLGYGEIHLSMLALHKPKNILVIGSDTGFIPAILGVAAKTYNGHLDFVDANYSMDNIDTRAYGGHGYWTPEYQQKFICAFNLQNTIQFHIETTRQFFEHNRQRYQYVYIDGDHSYDGVKYDFDHAYQCCDSGSWIIFHDARVEDGWNGFEFGIKKLLSEITLPHIIVGTFPGLAIVQV